MEVPREGELSCRECRRHFSCDQGIPLLFWPRGEDSSRGDVTRRVQSFYERYPFPDYEEIDSVFSLIRKAEQGAFARMLNEQIAPETRILEVGCGTGQLANYLGAAGQRVVFGTDMSLPSLRLAENFRRSNRIDQTIFLQMNLLKPCLKPESFDLVICNGVLHHTSDPLSGLQSISRLVKENGYLVVGLYNAYGRLLNDLRRWIFRISGGRFLFLDPHLRGRDLKEGKGKAWFMDQYRHPHESKHTFDRLLGWFDEAGLKFIRGIPNLTLGSSFSPREELFKPHSRGARLGRLLVQWGMLLRGGREGGFFLMIGQRLKGRID